MTLYAPWILCMLMSIHHMTVKHKHDGWKRRGPHMADPQVFRIGQRMHGRRDDGVSLRFVAVDICREPQSCNMSVNYSL